MGVADPQKYVHPHVLPRRNWSFEDGGISWGAPKWGALGSRPLGLVYASPLTNTNTPPTWVAVPKLIAVGQTVRDYGKPENRTPRIPPFKVTFKILGTDSGDRVPVTSY